jgi:hypothetical protein
MNPSTLLSALQPWASPLVALLALVVSLISFSLSRNTNLTSKRPILIFVYDGERGWVLQNIGNGPALNIVVAQKRVTGDKQWFDFVRIPPMSKDREFVLSYLNHVNDTGLGVTFEDMESRVYSTRCADDLNIPSSGLLFKPTGVVQVWKKQGGK